MSRFFMDEVLEKVLSTPIKDTYYQGITIRSYLTDLLQALWLEADGFDAKRPLGDSDWQDVVYMELIRSGLVKGSLTIDGCISEINQDEADDLMANVIYFMCSAT